MFFKISSALLCAAALLPSPSQAGLVDLFDESMATGFYVNDMPGGTLTYSADTQKLLYVSNGPFDIYTDWFGSTTFVASFEGTFTWQVSVFPKGQVLKPGTMTWFGDVGSGTELLATGRVRRIGFDVLLCNAAPDPSDPVDGPYCDWQTPQARIKITFVHPILEGLGKYIVAFPNLERLFGPDPPFLESFGCGPALPCNHFSDAAIFAVKKQKP